MIEPTREPAFRPRDAGAPVRAVVGAMNFGKRTPATEAEAIVARAWERGVRVFDTANVYGDGESERILGKALRGRGGALVATKVGLLRVDGRVEGLSGARIERALDDSRRRLGIDAIDLYYLHAPDPRTALEETVDALARRLADGAVRAWGVSNFAAWQILELDRLCDERGVARPAVSQVLYNLLVRQLDVEYFAFTRRYPIHTTTYNALAGGLLAGHRAHGPVPRGSRFDGNPMYQRRYWTEPLFARVERYAALATELGTTLLDLAYGWLAAQPTVDSILLGPASVGHLDAALDALARPLPADHVARVEALHAALTGTDARYAR